MKRNILFISLLFFACLSLLADNLKWVDPMIGTGGIGHTFPGATVPFGMLQVGPTNNFKAWNWCSGYHYSDRTLKGFAHNFISGAGLAALGDILLMPTNTNKFETLEDISGYDSHFSHNKEMASPGYYSVYLDDYSINVELTTIERLGCHRYTFDNGGYSCIIIDPRHGIMENIVDSKVEFKDYNTIIAYKRTIDGCAGSRVVSAYIHFSKPFNHYKEGNVGFVSFENLKKNEQIEVKICLSYVDAQGAELNYKAHDSNLNFNKIHKLAKESWRRVLDIFDVKSDNKSFLRNFYTAVYHSFLSPNLISDIDGRYKVEGRVFKSDIPQYSNFSTWDTFRALHPMYTLVEHKKTAEFVNSLISRYDCGLDLPVWECLGFDNVCMLGQNTISVISEAIIKGIPGINSEKAYKAMRSSINNTTKHSPNLNNNSSMKDYLIDGIARSYDRASVSKTLEYNYFDWCLAQIAEKLGKRDDYMYFMNRSFTHMKHFDQETGYFLPIDEYGRLEKTDKINDWDWLVFHYCSADIWGYSTFMPHNIEQLFNLHGGKKKFVEWLDRVFTDTTQLAGTNHVDISGFIGKYAHGDEPAQQMPYLYAMAGAPEKTRYYVRQAMNKFYIDKPDGLVNNDDLGQMSAWYIFSAMGLYPVNPCSGEYVLGIPYAEKMDIKLGNGRLFKVRTINYNPDSTDIKEIYFNGIEITSSRVRHDDIMKGGELLFIYN